MLKEKETENKEYLIPKSLAEVISYNTFCPCKNENSFLIFNSINEIHILIFFEIGKIVSYNLEEKKIIYEKKVERKEIINLFNHVCCDKKDLILVSFLNNNKVKIMDFINNEYISEISTLQNSIIKNIITFFHSNELTIIIHCNIGMLVQDQVDSYNYKSKVLKKIPLNLNTLIIFMKYYYDDNLDMNCILIGNKTEISIFNYEDITKIKNYYDYSNQLINGYHNYNSAFIIEYNNNKRIFSGCGDGAIRIWDYQSQHLLKKIDCFQSINFICLKTNNYLYIGFDNGEIILKDIISEKVLTIYRGHKKGISALKKISSQNDNYLISLGLSSDKIILWKNL